MTPLSNHARLGWQITGRLVASAGLGGIIAWGLIALMAMLLGGCESAEVIQIAGGWS